MPVRLIRYGPYELNLEILDIEYKQTHKSDDLPSSINHKIHDHILKEKLSSARKD